MDTSKVYALNWPFDGKMKNRNLRVEGFHMEKRRKVATWQGKEDPGVLIHRIIKATPQLQ